MVVENGRTFRFLQGLVSRLFGIGFYRRIHTRHLSEGVRRRSPRGALTLAERELCSGSKQSSQSVAREMGTRLG